MATSDEDRLTVVNVVASTRVAEELNLPDIAIQLNCEYEPEQFPGVVPLEFGDNSLSRVGLRWSLPGSRSTEQPFNPAPQ